MDKNIPVTLIHIRSFEPLSVTFPPPGTYWGKIALILPHPDGSILHRLGQGGGGQISVELTTSKPVTAEYLLDLIADQVSHLEMLRDQIAVPYRTEMLEHLRAGRTKTDKARTYKAASLPDPLESLHNEIPPGSWLQNGK